MKLKSLIKEHNELIPVEVELTLWPGLPGIQFVGLPDQHLKESSFRIKSAIKSAGFQWPQAQQILVNLRPAHLKKNSRGLELAVAMAYLIESKQVEYRLDHPQEYFYGELGLDGEVIEPDDLCNCFYDPKAQVFTGVPRGESPCCFARISIEHLRQIQERVFKKSDSQFFQTQRPEMFIQMDYSKEQANLIAILALGECSALIAGPQGSGKSTLAQSLWSFLTPPTERELLEIKKSQASLESNWRPLVKPHHSTPALSLLGGGNNLYRGELARADLGLLVLDELLEFHPKVQESLREPLEEKCMRVSRGGKMETHPMRFQAIATTNLCPCGEYVPGHKKLSNCRFSLIRCRSYSQKLSGPLVDRFDILYFTQKLKGFSVSGQQLLEQIELGRSFQKERRSKGGAPEPIYQTLLEVWPSQRRKKAVYKVSRALADLDQSWEVQAPHLQGAMELCLHNFERLKRWDC